MPRTHASAGIISIGDELAIGATLDTNAQWLASQLTDLGIGVVEHVTVADDDAALADAIRRLATRLDLVITTGGLGPTLDDLTRQALADVAGQHLVEDQQALAEIRAWFRGAGRDMPDANRVQAMRPAGAGILSNAHGTAPGLHLPGDNSRADVFCLPGPPREMVPMFHAHVARAIHPPAGRVVRTRVLRCFGIGESDLAGRLGNLMDRSRNPLVGTTVSGGVVSIRIRCEGDAPDAEQLIDEAMQESARRAAPYVFATGQATLAETVLQGLMAEGSTVATVESCTGGLVCKLLTDVPGSSNAVRGGWITYTNEMKQADVGVPASIVESDGAVSRACAEAMARGGLERSGATYCLAVTGVAGPGGGSADKPVGTVWICCAASDGRLDARLFRFPGERANVRSWSAMSALAMLRFMLAGLEGVPLLRQA